MDNILVWIFGTSGVAVVVVGIVSLWISSSQRRQESRNARRADRNAEIAYRREICTELLASLRDYFIAVEALRSFHDNLLERWKPFHPAQLKALRKMDAVQTVLARTASALSLSTEGRKVQSAGIEYLRAGNEYIQALAKPMQQFGGHFRKGNPQEISRLREIFSQRHIELENAASQYVGEPLSKPPSRVKQILTASKVWVHNIRPKKRFTP